MSVVEGITAAEFQNLDAEIKRTMRYSAKAVVGLGFLLRKMAEQKLWTVQYDCLDDYLREELHMDYTMASRFIGINKKYSVGGNSTEIEPMWADYSQAALIEMLSMPPELEAEITPDMTVKQIRSVKHAARKAKTELKKEAEPVKEKKCDTYPGYTCNIEEIVKKHFIKGGLIEGCARCCAVCLKKRECKYACEAVITMDVIKLADIPEEQTHVIPAQEDTGKVSGDEILDAEYRELETIEEVATSQPMVSAYGLEKTEYPEGSLLTTVGCGHRYYCFSCAQECDIRQEMCFCQTAPLGDPFGCDTVSLPEDRPLPETAAVFPVPVLGYVLSPLVHLQHYHLTRYPVFQDHPSSVWRLCLTVTSHTDIRSPHCIPCSREPPRSFPVYGTLKYYSQTGICYQHLLLGSL